MNGFSFAQNIKRPLRRLFTNSRAMLELSVLLGLCLAVFLAGRCTRFARLADAVRRDTLRLHVQAETNTPEAQLRKLLVRDAVLCEAAEIFAAAPDKSAALRLAQNALPRLQLTAEQAFWAAGGTPGTPVRVYLTEMYFSPTRYGSAALPAGRYDALRVELGRHAGRNWFCVLYPALCLPAAEGACYPTEEEQQLVEGGYEIRFAALEFLQRLTGWPGHAGGTGDVGNAGDAGDAQTGGAAQNEESPLPEGPAEGGGASSYHIGLTNRR